VSIKTRKASVAEIAVAIEEANPRAVGDNGAAATAESLMKDVEVDPEDASHVLGDLNWSRRGIVVLPETIGDLTVDCVLDLNHNELKSLPESFGSLTVGGHLNLSYNNLKSLPESFGSLAVGGTLYLQCNRTESLPESFGSLTVGGVLDLSRNGLASLPESFGSLTVGGEVILDQNPLCFNRYLNDHSYPGLTLKLDDY